MSSGGILFDAGRHLPEGLNIELSITWPVLLHNVAPMQLMASGRIVRASGRKIAIVVLSTPQWPVVRLHPARIAAAVNAACRARTC